MARRKDHSREELENLILDAAWTIIGQEGVTGLTARRIATDIGYTPGTIYNVFRAMDDVVMGVNGRTLDKLYTILNDLSCENPPKDPTEQAVMCMKTMARRYVAFAQEYRPYWLLLFYQGENEAVSVPETYTEKVHRLFQPLERILAPFFIAEDESEEKELLRVAARTLWASVHGICYLQETGKSSVAYPTPDTMILIDHLIDTYMAGLQTLKKEA